MGPIYIIGGSNGKTCPMCCKNLLIQFEKADERRLFEIVTVDETWIYYSQPLSKQKSKCWLAPGEPRPKKTRPDFRAKKVMCAIAFDGYGQVAQVCVPKGERVTGEFYSSQVISAIEKYYLERRPRSGGKGIKLLQDNASSHKVKGVIEYVERIGMKILEHPPYSPDLSPCDFWLFAKLKNHLSGKDFESRIEIGSAICRYLKSIPREEFKKTFRCWIQRLKQCIEVN